MNIQVPTRWVVALDAEGAPIRKRFGLTEAVHSGPFVTYHTPDLSHWLVVSGIGSALSAGATAFLAERSAAPAWALWLNVGIAGHGDAPIGTVYLAHTVVDRAAGQTKYATLAIKSPLPGCALHTVARPEAGYPAPVLYDMEGAGFYAVARRLVSAELVQCIKVVSDNPEAPVVRFSAAQITQWIAAGMDDVGAMHQALAPLSKSECERLAKPALYEQLMSAFRFSATQGGQLLECLRRLRALKIGDSLVQDRVADLSNTRDVLKSLRAMADAAAPHWSDP